ncbi:MAG: ABC transporter permease [Anaerolineae bacterium]|nr:ABC transporter permease [Anaerolineae bacterium]
MGKFVVQRFLWMVAVLVVVSATTFTLMHAIPGGPFSQEKALPAQTLAQLNKKYNLDSPLFAQFVDYVGDILIPVVMTGKQQKSLDHDYLINLKLPFEDNATLRWMNFGPSFKSTSRTVNDIFRDNFPISFQLGIIALIISGVMGIPLGILSALKRNTIYDYVGMGVAIVGVAVPVIITAPLLQYFFGVQLKWLPLTGWGNPNQMVLPSLTLGFGEAAIIARLTRASLLQVMNNDFIRTARAKGLSERRVIIVHALKNSMIPVVTVFGPAIAYLVTGTFVVETIFGIPGMGRFFVTSITGRDYPVIMGTILIFAVLLVVVNALVDIAYVWLDPRIRYS